MIARPIRMLAVLAAAVLLSRCSGCGTSEEPGCPSGQVKCNGFCVDPASFAADPLNCGGCGIACGLGTCSTGACQCTTGTPCPTSQPRCPDFASDPRNCGGCGTVCSRTHEGCADGTCQCVPGSAYPDDCGTLCTNVQDGDRANCGSCGRVCPHTNDDCVAGGCQCPDGLTDVCDATCVNLATDTSHCGTCTTVCATGAACTSGACACPTGESVCSNSCVNRQTDPSNCGTCGTACATTAACAAGSCTCPAEKPVACGGTLSGGTCCAGDGCCAGNTCQTQHSNGVGQNFYDCSPLATYNQAQAEKAAQAWHPADATTTEIPGTNFACPGCIGWQVSSATSACGTWCYTGPYQGRVFLVPSLVCVCATLNPGTWN